MHTEAPTYISIPTQREAPFLLPRDGLESRLLCTVSATSKEIEGGGGIRGTSCCTVTATSEELEGGDVFE